MSHAMTRREFTAASAAALTSFGFGSRARASESKTLRFIVRTDLLVLDPIWTTAYVSRNHGYMIFDTLFALDSKFEPQPQMVGDYSISPDKLVYRFALRPGLKFPRRPAGPRRRLHRLAAPLDGSRSARPGALRHDRRDDGRR